MANSSKSWALILHNDGRVQAWRDYGHTAWGAPTYTVLGYFDGSHRDAMRQARTLADPPGCFVERGLTQDIWGDCTPYGPCPCTECRILRAECA